LGDAEFRKESRIYYARVDEAESMHLKSFTLPQRIRGSLGDT